MIQDKISARYGFKYVPRERDRFAIFRTVPAVFRRLEAGEEVDSKFWQIV